MRPLPCSGSARVQACLRVQVLGTNWSRVRTMPTSLRIPRKPKLRAPSERLGPEADQLLRVIAETATDAIITIDERSIILFANPAAERIFGYRISEMLGQEVTTLMPTYLREVHRAALRRYLETGQKHTAWSALDLTGLHKSGREIPLEISLSDHAHDGKRTFTGIVRDLSDRARTDMQLRQTEEKYARMIQSSPDAITLRTLPRSEEHTSELQSPCNLVCRLLLEKKKK